jgi:hypothetical protein
MNWEAESRIRTREKGIGWWNGKKGKEDILAYWDCSHPYRKFFERKEKHGWLPGKTRSPRQKGAVTRELR